MQQPPPEKVKSLLVLHFALFLGQLIFALISLLLVSLKVMGTPVTGLHGEIVLAATILSLTAFLVSLYIFKQSLKKINGAKADLSQKLDLLLKANMKRWIILEIAGLLCIILFMLTQVFDIFILIIGLLIVFYLTRPTAINIARDLSVREYDILSMK